MNIRKRYLVHRKFQADFSLKILIAVLCPTLVGSLFVISYLKMSGWMGGISLQNLLVEGFIPSFALRVLPVVFAVVIFSVYFSHRIAGPVKRLQQACYSLAKGYPVKQIKLRKRDYFHDMANKLNILKEKNIINSKDE